MADWCVCEGCHKCSWERQEYGKCYAEIGKYERKNIAKGKRMCKGCGEAQIGRYESSSNSSEWSISALEARLGALEKRAASLLKEHFDTQQEIFDVRDMLGRARAEE